MEREAVSALTFESIMNEYGEEIKRFILTYVKDPSVTDDLVQEVFLKVYMKLDTFEDRAGLKTWLYRIAINCCKDYFRSWHYQRVKVVQTFDFLQGKVAPTPEDQVLRKIGDTTLAREILSLSPKYREVILLYYYRDFSVEEVASLLGLNPSTIRTRMKRAREQLKDKLGGEDLEP